MTKHSYIINLFFFNSNNEKKMTKTQHFNYNSEINLEHYKYPLSNPLSQNLAEFHQ